MKRIVLMGFDFECPNKGCEALSYSFVALLKRIYPNEKLEISNLTHKDSLGIFPKKFPEIKFIHYRATYKSLSFYLKLMDCFRRADVIFDITYGDIFSDIYGEKWLLKTNIFKQMAIMSKTPLILLPQTYGPFKNLKLKKWSLYLVGKSTKAFSRDKISQEYIKNECGVDIETVTDLAFALPFDAEMYHLESNKIKVGLNVSSLLWEGGFTKNNQFGLKVDYQKYCRELIQRLLQTRKYEIHLIPHVIEDVENAPENDLRPCRDLHAEFPETIIAPAFSTPVEAKSYIHQMDIFLGARMHATIGAFSSGVTTIPFSYSRKFEGLYNSLSYPFLISGTKLSTEEALDKTHEFFENRADLDNRRDEGMRVVNAQLERLLSELK